MSASTTAQMAAITALTDPRAEDAVLAMRESYDVRRKLLLQGLASIGLPAFEPARRVLCVPRHPRQRDDVGRVRDDPAGGGSGGVRAGPAFGLGGEGYVRMCYATATGQDRGGARADASVRVTARISKDCRGCCALLRPLAPYAGDHSVQARQRSRAISARNSAWRLRLFVLRQHAGPDSVQAYLLQLVRRKPEVVHQQARTPCSGPC